jgi:hypothetical protein
LKTSLYNHKSIGTKEKPLIPNIIFKSLLFLMKHDQIQDAEYIKKNYTLTEFQNNLINKLQKNELDTTIQTGAQRLG